MTGLREPVDGPVDGPVAATVEAAEQFSLARLIDREQIAAAMAVYTRCADLNRPDDQVQVFTEDCRVSYHPGEWIEGRGRLAEALRVSLARFQRTSHHLATSRSASTAPTRRPRRAR